ncbi:MAG: AAA family ATPase, partial [Simkaniaceae bacterium]|nr:AAA family ATPase [Simkaniaceae bacterium]
MIRRITLRNFRNYERATISFLPGINLVHGKNGAGKTNLLEALYLLSTGRSFRTPRLNDLIRTGEDYFFIEVAFEKEGTEHTLAAGFDGKKGKASHNRTELPSFSKLPGILPGVLHSEGDDRL